MIDEINQAIENYHLQWHALIDERKDKDFFHNLKPTAVGWKVFDLIEFNERAAALRELSEQVHYGWIDGRWLATFYLREKLSCGMQVIKLMQRRPQSTDAVGLDHLDFLMTDKDRAKEVLANEANVKWTEEHNGKHAQWISIWFQRTEAKLRTDTVLEVCARELLDHEKTLTGDL